MPLRILILLIPLALFSACGQKGDLYLPERQPVPAPDQTEQPDDEPDHDEEEVEGER